MSVSSSNMGAQSVATPDIPPPVTPANTPPQMSRQEAKVMAFAVAAQSGYRDAQPFNARVARESGILKRVDFTYKPSCCATLLRQIAAAALLVIGILALTIPFWFKGYADAIDNLSAQRPIIEYQVTDKVMEKAKSLGTKPYFKQCVAPRISSEMIAAFKERNARLSMGENDVSALIDLADVPPSGASTSSAGDGASTSRATTPQQEPVAEESAGATAVGGDQPQTRLDKFTAKARRLKAKVTAAFRRNPKPPGPSLTATSSSHQPPEAAGSNPAQPSLEAVTALT